MINFVLKSILINVLYRSMDLMPVGLSEFYTLLSLNSVLFAALFLPTKLYLTHAFLSTIFLSLSSFFEKGNLFMTLIIISSIIRWGHKKILEFEKFKELIIIFFANFGFFITWNLIGHIFHKQPIQHWSHIITKQQILVSIFNGFAWLIQKRLEMVFWKRSASSWR